MKEIVHRLKFSARLFPVMVLLGISIQLSFSYIMTFLLSLNEAAEKEYDEVIAPLVSMEPSMIFYVGFGAPFFEELLFRGVVLGILVLIINRLHRDPVFWYAAANIIQALLFALYHGNVYQGIYAFLIGLIFGYIFILTGSAVPGCGPFIRQSFRAVCGESDTGRNFPDPSVGFGFCGAFRDRLLHARGQKTLRL